MWLISYPPANGESQGNYFLPKSHKLAVFEENQAYKIGRDSTDGKGAASYPGFESSRFLFHAAACLANNE